jgi:hypothetical protein
MTALQFAEKWLVRDLANVWSMLDKSTLVRKFRIGVHQYLIPIYAGDIAAR